jgi:tetratricopeptide (TPR) repeat protein/DNA-binding SARP family transcriptional activator
MTVMGVPQQVRFQLLGRFEVQFGGRVVRVGGPTAQAALVTLLDRPGQIKQPGELVRAVWPRPETVADDSLYHYISKVRKALHGTGVRIDNCWPGYRIALTEGAFVDAQRFADLLVEGEALRHTEPERAVRALRAALDLWQEGPPLPGLDQPGVRAVAARLTGQRLAAAGLLGELELAAGRPDQVLARIPLALSHVDSGGPVAATLRALHATARGGEALGLLRRAEEAARVNERGLPEPVRQARELLMGGTPATPGIAPGVPYQLPADTTHFTGRQAEMARLRALWPASGQPGTLVVAALDGMAGIGKTALAVHAAHELAPRFPDGNLFLDLHGFTPKTRPTAPEKALDILLRGLSVPGAQIPRDPDARAALYRSRLTGRRMLIVLDNALDEAQVRPLLPGTSGCLVIVTSRRRLSGVDDAHHLTLETLRPEDAAELFRKVASDRADGDHQVVSQIVRSCGELPLAIRIAAARLRTSRALSPSSLLGFLRKGREEPELAGLDDGARSIAAAFEVSYRHLSPQQRHAFRLLGIHPGPAFDAYAAAALLGVGLEPARHLLGALEQVNLLLQPAAGRYSFHDLLRAYATGLAPDPADAAETDAPAGEAAPRQALERLLDHYSFGTAAAMDALFPYERAYRPRIAAPGSPLPPPAYDRDRAGAWLQEELPNLLAATGPAAAHPRYVLDLSALLARYLRTQLRYAEAHALHTQALEIARERGDELSEMAALIELGRVDQLTGQHARAAGHNQRALEIARRNSHQHGQIRALVGLGHVARLTTRDESAIERYRQALELATAAGHPIGQIDAHWGLGRIRVRAGEHRQAGRDFAAALRLASRSGHRGGEIRALTGLGHLYRCAGELDRAGEHLNRALAVAVEVGDLSGEVFGLCGLGDVALHQHRYGEAGERYRAALERARDSGDRNGEYEALHGLGRALHAAGQPGAALDCHQQSGEIADALGQPHDQARAHGAMARAYCDLGQPERAREHWRRALAILTDLDAPGTEYIARQLAALA